ncbi:FabD/lysophospholipase-like protein, partial [Schizopora paradoxa]
MFRPLLSSFVLLAAVQAQSITPSGNYTPTFVPCPTDSSLVRPASEGLSSAEKAWLQKRTPNVISALETYLGNVGIPGFNTSDYVAALRAKESAAPVIGVTFSGGGNRATLVGLGMYQALDSRVPDAIAAKTGGILQAATYIAGLSGGASTTAVIGVNDFARVSDLLAAGNLNFSAGPPQTAFSVIADKAELGFNISISDILGINEGFFYFKTANASVDQLSLTWSGIQTNPTFLNASYPLPILMANEVIPSGLPGSNSFETPNGTVLFPRYENNDTIYEITPIEYGSWQGRASAFASTKFSGTALSSGAPLDSNRCVEGYDSAAFTLGSVVTAINLWIIENLTDGIDGQFAKRDVKGTKTSSTFIPYPTNAAQLGEERTANASTAFVEMLPLLFELMGNPPFESALYGLWPNPFIGFNASSESLQKQSELMLVDGSEVGQENPIVPLIQPARNLDFIIVSDGSGSELSSGWMNGTNFLNTDTWAKGNNLPFPKLPDVNTMLNLKFTTFPTFFGCNEPDVPLLLYVADFPYTSFNNFSFLDDFPSGQEQIIMSNALSTISQDSDRLTANWTSCLACGTVLRSLQKLDMKVPEFCETCFKDHCWQGNSANSAPSFLQPSALLTNPNITFDIWNQTIFFNSSA